MIVITRIPTHRNDGSKVSTRELQKILEPVRDAFLGYSLERPSPGVWVHADGKVYAEESRKLEVIIARDRVAEALELFKSIGKQLGQRAIYFEAREGGEIIDLE